MNLNEAADFVHARLAPDDDPCLSGDELDQCLSLAATADDHGREPGDDGWTPTYSMSGCYRAIIEGWTIKHGKVVGRFDFTTDGQTFRRSQQLDHIEAQRQRWVRKLQYTTSTLGRS